MKKLFTIAFMFLMVKVCFSQKLPSGPQVLTIFSHADDTEQPYGLYLPKNYDEHKKYPLVIMLHGAGSNHRLALRRVFGKSNMNGENDVEATRYFPEWNDVDYIVASPYARGTAGYQGIPEKDVLDVLADVKKRFNIDEDRTYLTGLSMGGGGTLWIGLTHPDIWAAIAPVCPAPPQGTDQLLPNAYNIPSHFFHGDQDKAVPVTVSREWVSKLKDLGASVEYDEYPGVEHNSWEKAYQDEAIFSWFAKFKRNLFPDRVMYNTDRYEYNKAYWITIDQLTTGTLATIDAKFINENQLDIKTSNLGAFTMNFEGHPKFNAANKMLQISIDGKKLKIPTANSISLSFDGKKWESKKYEVSANTKRKNAEGPVSAAFASRHIYVYGTKDHPDETVLKQRMEQATQAANWSAYRNAFLGRIMFFPRVVADRDVRPSDLESCNLILFGTKETNSFVDKYASQLPLHLKEESVKDHGLVYIFPVNDHYVVVNSGLTWWTGSDQQNYRFAPVFSEIPRMKDFILFKETIKNIVTEGYFTNDWKLNPETQKVLTSSVNINQQ